MLIGTAGHIDHGKTTLVKALTGVDADRLPQEKARGITLDLGYAYQPLADGSILGFVDVPGHEKLIRNMLAGVTAIDFVLLVIAADDGPMPQTREHIELLELLGLRYGAVALTKMDTVTPERLGQAQSEINDLVSGTGLVDCPIFPLSARDGRGVAQLARHLEAAAMSHPPRPATGHFRLAIDRSFSLDGVGTVVTGTAHSGNVKIDDKLVISPGRYSARVRSLRVQDREAVSGGAGQRCALALKGDFDKKDIRRGMWVIDPALHEPVSRFHAELRIPEGGQPLKHLQHVHVHLGTDDIVARVALLDCRHVDPGATALVEILLERETCTLYGDRFIVRDAGAQRTIAGGRVLDIFPPARHKRSTERLELLRRLRAEDPVSALTSIADQSHTGVDLARFGLSRNLTDSDLQTIAQHAQLRIVSVGDSAQSGFTENAWDNLGAKALEALRHEHARMPDMVGVEPERLRRMVANELPRRAFDLLCTELLSSGAMARTKTWLHLPEHCAHITTSDRALFDELKSLLDQQPYNPPRVRDVFNATGTPEGTVRKLFKRAARAGELYPVAHDHYFTASAVAELADIVRRLNEAEGAARAAPFRNAIFSDGTGGRKVAIRILEFFDRVGYTRRIRDDHVLRPESAVRDWTAR